MGPNLPPTLKNTSTAALSIIGVGITGKNLGDFSQTNTCGEGVAAGKTCTVRVIFKPTAKGARSASVIVDDNGGASPQTVPVTGTGT